MKRVYPLLDILRGIAVILMIIFHTAFHLTSFNYINVDFYTPNFWYYLPRFIVFLFLFCSGFALGITHFPIKKKEPFIKREIRLGVLAIIISISTFFMYPDRWVYFGTIHAICFASLLGYIFIQHSLIGLIITSLIFIIDQTTQIDLFPIKLIFPHPSLDYIPLFPWCAAMFFGLYLSTKDKIKNFFMLEIKVISPFLKILGQHSLIIYLTHHGVILALIFTYRYLFPSH